MNPIAAAAGALALAAGGASAQGYPSSYGGSQPYPYPGTAPSLYAQSYDHPYGSGPSLTLYEGENFTGREITLYGEERDLSRVGFNDRARSARTNGAFVVCEDSEYRGRCERLSGSVRSLAQLGLNARISSGRDERLNGGYDDPEGPGGGYGEGRDRYDDDRPGRDGGYANPRRDGVEGRTAIFFARPSVSGNDVAARGQASADQFCRASGHGPAIYYAQGERSRRAVDQDGRVVDAPALRDVLCRTNRNGRGF